MSSSNSTLPDPRRVITGHDAEGKSIVVRDEARKPFVLSTSMLRHDMYVTNEHPAKVDSEISTGTWKDEAETMTPMFKENGSVFSYLDFAPAAAVVS